MWIQLRSRSGNAEFSFMFIWDPIHLGHRSEVSPVGLVDTKGTDSLMVRMAVSTLNVGTNSIVREGQILARALNLARSW